MKKNTNIKRWLGAVLVIQLILVVVVFNMNKSSRESENRSLVTNFEDVDRIVITDGKKQSELVRKSGQWGLPELQNLPVNKVKLQTQLDKLSAQQLRWPVATSSSSHERFKVADDSFNKRIDFYQGEEKLNSLYLGESLGLKEAYIRELESNKTFTVGLNAVDFAVNDNDWLDKQLLKMESVTVIETRNFKIEMHDSQWRLASEPPSTDDGEERALEFDEAEASSAEPAHDDDSNEQSVVQSKAIEIANSLSSLTVLDAASDLDWSNAIALTATAEEDSWSYLFVENDGNYYVKRSDQSIGFEISRSTYEKLTKHSLDDILEKKVLDSEVES